MTTVCFGPPPLPPNKKSTILTNGYRCRKHSLLSSTYHSFRDPAEESDIIVVNLNSNPYADQKYQLNGKRQCSNSGGANTLSRCKEPVRMMIRSHSDGNLNKKERSAPMTINKYIKVLSGSWKNLLNRKFWYLFLKLFCNLIIELKILAYTLQKILFNALKMLPNSHQFSGFLSAQII